MQKIYLKYDEYTPPIECDYGFIKEMLYLDAESRYIGVFKIMGENKQY